MNNMINAEKFYKILLYANESLQKNIEYLNSLNVFPVPDGDTGTNMAATFNEAVRKINMNNNSTIGSIAAELCKGALLGARGNSGVILSQILRGLAKGLENVEELSPESLGDALVSAKEQAYKAVLSPKEGTILSVIRAASESSLNHKKIDNILSFVDVILDDTKVMLNETKNMLPENKRAGTVDAGGAGLVIILQAFSDVMHNKVESTSFDFNSKEINVEYVDIHPSAEDIKFQYCTEFIIKAAVNESILRDRLSGIGDCVVVVSMDDITKVHLHTNTPGTAINYATAYGDLTRLKIDNMKEQSEASNSNTKVEPKKDIALIAIASGAGTKDAFIQSGADYVISGGQSMNPSVEDIMDAIKKANANKVIILPNNKNIILAAEQCKALSDCEIEVVKSKSIPQGLTSILAYDKELSLEDNYKAMTATLADVISCQVTTAVKDSNSNGLNILKGDVIGIKEDTIVVNSNDIRTVLISLFEDSITEDISTVTILYGSDVSEDLSKNIVEELVERYPDLDICSFSGGQEVYSFILGFE
ncbi:DAK2 domain-containing protein (plasmid) [Clostridium perfringens]